MAYIGKSPTGSGVRTRYYYTATGGETSLSGADDNGKTLTFSDGEYMDVYLNGVLLVHGTDYGTGTANTISSLAALAGGDIAEVIVYDVYNIADVNRKALRTRYYKTAAGGETSISGTDDSGATITFAANAQIEVKLNGVSLVQGTDYNTTSANTVGGLAALTAGQVVEIVKYERFVLGDTVSKADGGTFSGSVGFSGGINGDVAFDTNTLYVDSANNRVGVGTSSPASAAHISSSAYPQIEIDDKASRNYAMGVTSSTFRIRDVTGTADRLTIDTSGNVLVGTTTATGARVVVEGPNSITATATANSSVAYEGIYLGTGTGYFGYWKYGASVVGSISSTGSSTSYNTSSDYRLKTNVNYDWDATSRLKQLKPARFEWISDGDDAVPVDGFLAHEVSDIVPEAITGTKDAVDDDGNPIYQGIDQSKLTPLLTKALIEAVEKIEQLEARITALENT
jgi:hypothetical protein